MIPSVFSQQLRRGVEHFLRTTFPVDDIAAYLGIKRDTVYRWISERNMPGNKIGRFWKFNKMEVDEWVKSGGAKRNKSKEEE